MMTERKRKMVWIVDRHPVHRSQLIKQWLQEHRQAIELLYLPPYSPQLNSVSQLRCQARSALQAIGS